MKRQNNIEVLRVICMFLIVVSHYMYHGLKENPIAHGFGLYPLSIVDNSAFFNYTFMELYYLISRVAVDCYVMITGYFLISRLSFRWKGLLTVYIQTLFYSAGIALLFYLLGLLPSIKTVLPYFIPVHSNAYWFVTTYIGLLLLAPFLSKGVMSLSKRNYLLLLLVLFIMNFQPLYGQVFSNRIFQFVALYLVGGYFRLYGICNLWKRNSKKVYILVLMILYVMATFYNWIVNRNGWELKSSEYNDLILFLALATFVVFLQMSCESKKWILFAKLSPYTFGVYLIHDHELIRNYLWKNIVCNEIHIPMFLHCLIISLLVFFICIFLDFFRSKIFRICKIDGLIGFVSNKVIKITI